METIKDICELYSITRLEHAKIAKRTLEATLKAFKRIPWRQGALAYAENGDPLIITFNDVDKRYLKRIKSCCLLGHIRIAVVDELADELTPEERERASHITTSLLLDTMMDGPEADTLKKGDSIVNWNDNLSPETGSKQVHTLLSRTYIRTLDLFREAVYSANRTASEQPY